MESTEETGPHRSNGASESPFVSVSPLLLFKTGPSVTLPLFEDPEQSGQRIVVAIDDAFLQRNDGVVGDVNVLRAHARAALGDVAVAGFRRIKRP